MSIQPQQREPFGEPILIVGRYAVFDEFSSGGFATVHLGRAVGVGGFTRTVAIKRLHRQYARDPEVSAMFLDEAKIVARIRHPNVLPTLDLIAEDDELFLVMEYVEGVPLSYLLRHARQRNRLIPLGVALRILCGALHGLHAAHEARDERGELMDLVHRDVSPDNVLVGVDGMPRLLDFGVAKALGQFHATREGEVKGKLAYITPEQVRGDEITHRSDIFSASVVLWEAMTGRRLFNAKSVAAIAHALLTQVIPPPSEIAGTPKKLDGIVLQGLERDPDKRWGSAERMAAALEAVGELASQPAVARYVRQAGGERIAERVRQVAAVEAAEIDTSRFNPRSSQADADVSAMDLQLAKALLAARLAQEAADSFPGALASDPGSLSQPGQALSSQPGPAPYSQPGRVDPYSQPGRPSHNAGELTPRPPAEVFAPTPEPPAVVTSPRAVSPSIGSTEPSAIDLAQLADPTQRRHTMALPVVLGAAVIVLTVVLLATRGSEPEGSPRPAASAPTAAPTPEATATAPAPTTAPQATAQPSAEPTAAPIPTPTSAPSPTIPPVKTTAPKGWPKPPPKGGLYGRD